MWSDLRGRDDGMSLTEVLISMVVFSIAIGLAYSAVILVMSRSNDAQQSADAVAELRIALAQIDRQVRSGNVLFSPAFEDEPDTCLALGGDENAGTCMRIYTQSNGDHKCVQWQLARDEDAGADLYRLQTRSWEPDWQVSGEVSEWSVVARNIYLDLGAADPADYDPYRAPFMLEGADTVYRERMLRIYLQAWDERQQAPIVIQSSVTGRNTSYGYDAGQCSPVPPA